MTEGCGKIGYPTKKDAATKMNAILANRTIKKARGVHRRHPHNGTMRIYPCPVCRQWHITSQEKRT